MRKPALNGKMDTMEKLGTNGFNSNIGFDSPKKSVAYSKFSSAYQDTLKEEFEDNNSPRSRKSQKEGGIGNLSMSGSLGGGIKGGGEGINQNLSQKGGRGVIHNFNKLETMSPKKSAALYDSIPEENPNIKMDWEAKKAGINKKTKNFEK